MNQLSATAISALLTATLAALLLLHHVLIRPKLTGATRIRLLLGLGVFPAATAALNTAEAMERSTTRQFCGSCHVMEQHLRDASDPESTSLASRHGRSAYIGETNCYRCHADYDGMMGYSLTKLRGMRHVYLYYFGGYRNMPQETAIRKIAIAKPYPNSNCLQCHSGKLDSFRDVREHTALREELETNHVACASAGCHGYSHPFSKGVTSEHATR
jgi:cytochrome c-type protein NapC